MARNVKTQRTTVRVNGRAMKSARPVHDARRAKLANVEAHEPAGMSDPESLAEDATEVGQMMNNSSGRTY